MNGISGKFLTNNNKQDLISQPNGLLSISDFFIYDRTVDGF